MPASSSQPGASPPSPARWQTFGPRSAIPGPAFSGARHRRRRTSPAIRPAPMPSPDARRSTAATRPSSSRRRGGSSIGAGRGALAWPAERRRDRSPLRISPLLRDRRAVPLGLVRCVSARWPAGGPRRRPVDRNGVIAATKIPPVLPARSRSRTSRTALGPSHCHGSSTAPAAIRIAGCWTASAGMAPVG